MTAPVGKLDIPELFALVPLHRQFGLVVQPQANGVTIAGALGADAARADAITAVHGGIIATLLDSATTFALLAVTDRLWMTLDLRVDYLKPVPLGEVRAIARVVRAGRTIGRARAELFCGSDSEPSALGVATFSSAQ